MGSVTVTPTDAKTARQVVERWHYSGRMPSGAKLLYACHEGEQFVGVIVLGVGVGKPLMHDLGKGSWLELQRIAMREHEAPVSQYVAELMKRLKVHHKSLRLIVSYADPYHGHHGGIYQAGGWVYTGTTSPSSAYLSPYGEMKHSRVVSASGINRQFGAQKRAWRKEVFEQIAMPGKHRYLMPLDNGMRRRLAKMAKPYPHARVRSLNGETAPIQGQVPVQSQPDAQQ